MKWDSENAYYTVGILYSNNCHVSYIHEVSVQISQSSAVLRLLLQETVCHLMYV